MSAKQRFLRDESRAVFALGAVITAIVVTLGMVAIAAWRGAAELADNRAVVGMSVV
jgi:hypothetical protein